MLHIEMAFLNDHFHKSILSTLLILSVGLKIRFQVETRPPL